MQITPEFCVFRVGIIHGKMHVSDRLEAWRKPRNKGLSAMKGTKKPPRNVRVAFWGGFCGVSCGD